MRKKIELLLLIKKEEDILSYTLDKYNLTIDRYKSYCYDEMDPSFVVKILSNDVVLIKDKSYSPQTDEYISNLIEEYYINKRNDIIDDILK